MPPDGPDLDRLVAHATDLADADEKLRHRLVQSRRTSGLTQADVAAALGWSPSAVARFERYDSDPRLSHVRRYALAVGARITHDVHAPGS